MVKESRLNFFLFYWFPVLFYCGIIFTLSSFSFDLKTVESLHVDKIVHLIEYFLLGVLASRAFNNSFPRVAVFKYYFLIILFCSLYGLSDEIHQLFVPGREFSGADILADVLGASIGALVYRLRFIKSRGFYLGYGKD